MSWRWKSCRAADAKKYATLTDLIVGGFITDRENSCRDVSNSTIFCPTNKQVALTVTCAETGNKVRICLLDIIVECVAYLWCTASQVVKYQSRLRINFSQNSVEGLKFYLPIYQRLHLFDRKTFYSDILMLLWQDSVSEALKRPSNCRYMLQKQRNSPSHGLNSSHHALP